MVRVKDTLVMKPLRPTQSHATVVNSPTTTVKTGEELILTIVVAAPSRIAIGILVEEKGYPRERKQTQKRENVAVSSNLKIY